MRSMPYGAWCPAAKWAYRQRFCVCFWGGAACVYSAVIRIRNLLYDKGLFRAYAVTPAGLITSDRSQNSIPVISIGNITAGGTGKTPMAVWLCNFLQSKGVKCAILTRGYRSSQGQFDEPALLAKNCPGSAVVVNPDRLKGAIEAVRRHRAQVLIMDDGFQHRRLHRVLDIVMVDATVPFGFGRILPAGLLREPVTSLKRAQAVVLTRCDQVGEDKSAQMIKNINPNILIARAIHEPVYAATAGDKKISLDELKGKSAFAFCGIANPDAFFATVKSLGVEIAGSKVYDDHHNYTVRDIEEIAKEAAQKSAPAAPPYVLTTEKDYNKIRQPVIEKTGLVLAYLAVKLRFVEGEAGVSRLIERAIAGKIPEKRMS